MLGQATVPVPFLKLRLTITRSPKLLACTSPGTMASTQHTLQYTKEVGKKRSKIPFTIVIVSASCLENWRLELIACCCCNGRTLCCSLLTNVQRTCRILSLWIRLEWHSTHQCTIQKIPFWDPFGWDETQPQDPVHWGSGFFFPLCHPTPNVSPSYLLPTHSYLLPTLFYLPTFPLTLPLFHSKHCVATIAPPLLPLPSSAPPSPMLLPSPLSYALPLVARSCVVSSYVVANNKKLCY